MMNIDMKKTETKTKKEVKSTSTKQTKKSIIKPSFIVNLSECETPIEVIAQFGYAKQAAGLPISNDELGCIEACVVNDTMELCEFAENAKKFAMNAIRELNDVLVKADVEVAEKKPGILKRFWNWVKRPFKRNK